MVERFEKRFHSMGLGVKKYAKIRYAGSDNNSYLRKMQTVYPL